MKILLFYQLATMIHILFSFMNHQTSYRHVHIYSCPICTRSHSQVHAFYMICSLTSKRNQDRAALQGCWGITEHIMRFMTVENLLSRLSSTFPGNWLLLCTSALLKTSVILLSQSHHLCHLREALRGWGPKNGSIKWVYREAVGSEYDKNKDKNLSCI